MQKELIKRFIQKSFVHSGACNITKKLKKGASIFFYHGAVEEIVNPVVQETHISMKQFEKHVLYLKKNFEVISLDYLNECISKGHKIDPSHVLLTFDDGYINNLHNVAPFLKSHNMPLTVFISTKFINSNDDLRLPYYYVRVAIFYAEQNIIEIPSIKKKYDIDMPERRISVINEVLNIIKTVPQKLVSQIVDDLMGLLPGDRWLELNALFSSDEIMNWDDVKKLNDSGVTIGSHCHDHAVLHSDQSDAETDYQLKNSKELIEKHLGACRYFSYPNGRKADISHFSIRSVKKNNYSLGFTTAPGEVENRVNPFIIPRLFPHKDMERFRFMLNTSFRHNVNYYKWSSSF